MDVYRYNISKNWFKMLIQKDLIISKLFMQNEGLNVEYSYNCKYSTVETYLNGLFIIIFSKSHQKINNFSVFLIIHNRKRRLYLYYTIQIYIRLSNRKFNYQNLYVEKHLFDV